MVSHSLLPAQGPNVYVKSGGGHVCSWATTLTGIDGSVSTCPAPPPPPPSSPSPPPPSTGDQTGVIIGVSVFVGVSVLGVAILGFVCWRRKRARTTERRGQLISAPTYDIGLNEAFISAAQPSSQPPVVAVQMPAMTPEAAPQAPIINTIPTTTPVFGADGKPIINTIPTTTPVFGADGKPIINTIPTTTSVFGADGKPASHNVVLDLD